MTRNQITFLFVLSLYTVLDFVLGTLLGIYLWNETKNTSTILWYYIVLFAVIIAASQLSNIFIKWFGVKRTYQLAMVVSVVQVGVIMLLQAKLSVYYYVVAALAGLSIGLQSVTYNMITSAIVSVSENTRYISIKSAIMNIISILTVPIMANVVRVTGGYMVTYLIALITGLAIIVVVSILKLNKTEQINEKKSLSLIEVWNTKSGQYYLISRLFFGMFNAPIWAVLGLITYQFVGNITIWSFITTSFMVAQIIGSFLYGKINTPNYHRAGAVIATLIFSGVAIMLGTNWNFTTFLIYQLGLVLLNIAFSIYYEKTIYTVLQCPEYLDKQENVLTSGEIILGIGRLLALFILVFANFSLENTNILRLVFVGIASIPLIILSIAPAEKNRV